MRSMFNHRIPRAGLANRIFLVISFSLATNSTMALQDNFNLTGFNIAVGNDGPAEALQNPAYISLPISSNYYEISSDHTLNLLRLGEISSLSGSSLNSGSQYTGNLGFTYHNVAGNWLHIAAVFGGQDNPVVQSASLSGGVQKPFANVSTYTTDTASISTRANEISGALGFGFRLSKLHRFGLSFQTASRTASTGYTANIAGSTAASVAVTSTIDISSSSKSLYLNPVLGYVYNQKDGDIGIVIKPYPVQQLTRSRNFNFNYTSTATTTINETTTSSIALLDRPSIAAGFSQEFFRRFRLFAGSEVGVPFQKSHSDHTISGSTVSEINVLEKYGPSFKVSLGGSVTILDWISGYGGLSMKTATIETSSGNSAQSYLQFKDKTSTSWVGNIGVGFFNADPYYAYIGFGYSYLLENEPIVTRSSNSTDNRGIQLRVEGYLMTIGGRYVF